MHFETHPEIPLGHPGAVLNNQTVVIADHVYSTRKYLEAQLRSWQMRCLLLGRHCVRVSETPGADSIDFKRNII